MDKSVPNRRSKTAQTTWGGLALAALVAIYSFARPAIDQQMGWNLPAVKPAALVGDKPVVDTRERELVHGLLRDLGNERYLSPAGLLFTRGGAEGHRLDHLERHTRDDPTRPGKHGVFDGGMPGALKTIDRAYDRAKAGERTTKEIDQGRTIYTVDLGGRVGYVGGRVGNRQSKPMARRVRIVLDKDRVITAYPM